MCTSFLNVAFFWKPQPQSHLRPTPSNWIISTYCLYCISFRVPAELQYFLSFHHFLAVFIISSCPPGKGKLIKINFQSSPKLTHFAWLSIQCEAAYAQSWTRRLCDSLTDTLTCRCACTRTCMCDSLAQRQFKAPDSSESL